MWNLEAYSFWPNSASQYFREQSHLEIQLWFNLKFLISSTAIRTLLTSQVCVHLMFPHRHRLPSPSVYSALLPHCCFSADLPLNPKDSCHQWGGKFLSGKGKKKAIFQHQTMFSWHLLLHPQLLYPSSSPHSLSFCESLNFWCQNFSGGRSLWQVSLVWKPNYPYFSY